MPSPAPRVDARMFSRPLECDAMLPEFAAVRRDPEKAARKPAARKLLRACDELAGELDGIPPLTYTQYAQFDRTGDVGAFHHPSTQRRRNLAAAAVLALFRREPKWIDLLQDYVWAICEETTWVVSAHKYYAPEIDLVAAETAFALAELVHVLGDRLAADVVERVRSEVRRRIFDPYLDHAEKLRWFNLRANWNGVCNGSIGAALLYLEPDARRLAAGINKVLESLAYYREHGFEPDGGCPEGPGYWQYGLINVVAFSELLRNRTGGAVELLAHERFRKIARFPLAVRVGPGRYHSYSDSSGAMRFFPGVVCRLAERTGVKDLEHILTRHAVAMHPGKLTMNLRDLLWWDGRTHTPSRIEDSLLPRTGVARLVGPGRTPIVMVKAGHNCEPHNHNDVGSFAVYAGEEALLCDPGAGAYSKQYFDEHRYENVLCNSYGHSVPRIGGSLEKVGANYRGTILQFEPGKEAKTCTVEFARAYGVKGLRALTRTLAVAMAGRKAGRVTLEDRFEFAGKPQAIEEAFLTWLPVSVRGRVARIRGEKASLVLKVLEPVAASLSVERIEVNRKQQGRPARLHRIACLLPRGCTRFSAEMTVTG